MKALAILFRVVFSIIILLACAFYLQVSPTATLGQYCDSLNTDSLLSMLSSVNAVTVSLVVILILGIFSWARLLDAVWNVLFCASILVLLAGGLYVAFGPGIALPSAIYHNEAVNQFCQPLTTYQVPIAIITLIFVAGWLCASACVRVAITAVVSYGLWYGITELFSYIVYLWGNSDTPAMPEALNMVQGTPWVIAAVPAAFFLIYALLMAFFETYITHAPAQAAKVADSPKTEEKPAEEPAKDKEGSAAESKAAGEAPKLKLVTKPATEAPKAKKELKTDAKPAAEPPKTAEKPAEEAPKPQKEPKIEEKPAAEAPKNEKNQTDDSPKAQEANKEEEKPTEYTPKNQEESKVGEKPANEAPQSEEKPAEAASTK